MHSIENSGLEILYLERMFDSNGIHLQTCTRQFYRLEYLHRLHCLLESIIIFDVLKSVNTICYTNIFI